MARFWSILAARQPRSVLRFEGYVVEYHNSLFRAIEAEADFSNLRRTQGWEILQRDSVALQDWFGVFLVASIAKLSELDVFDVERLVNGADGGERQTGGFAVRGQQFDGKVERRFALLVVVFFDVLFLVLLGFATSFLASGLASGLPSFLVLSLSLVLSASGSGGFSLVSAQVK